jgi:hypothetical protein
MELQLFLESVIGTVLGFFGDLFAIFGGFWERFTTESLMEMTPLELLIFVGFSFLAYKLAVLLLVRAKNGAVVSARVVGKLLSHFSVKARASRTVCIHCGRTMDKCVCATNKGVSLGRRLRKQKLELKLKKKLAKVGK